MFECKTEEEALALLKAQGPPVLGETMETRDFEGWTALHWAANRGYSELSAQLLAQDPKLVAVLAKDNSTALHCAARRGHVDIVAQLLAHASRDVIFATKNTWTALDMALAQGHEEVVGQLFDHNPEWIETVTLNGDNTGLFSAAKQGHAKVVAQVLARGPRRCDPTTREVSTVLDGAAFGGHENIVSQLLEYDPSLLHDKSTAVHSAANKGHNKLIAQLLARNPKLLDADDHESSLLHSAVASGSVETMSQLLALKPEMIDAADSFGRTPLQKAFLYTIDISAIVSFLLATKPEQAYGVNNKDGNTLLHQAVLRWRFKDDDRELAEIVWRLNPEALHTPNREGQTPLQIGGDLDPWTSLRLFQSQCSIDQLQDATFLALDLEQFRPVIEQQCESLATTLLYPDLAHIVYIYLGLDDDDKS